MKNSNSTQFKSNLFETHPLLIWGRGYCVKTVNKLVFSNYIFLKFLLVWLAWLDFTLFFVYPWLRVKLAFAKKSWEFLWFRGQIGELLKPELVHNYSDKKHKVIDFIKHHLGKGQRPVSKTWYLALLWLTSHALFPDPPGNKPLHWATVPVLMAYLITSTPL